MLQKLCCSDATSGEPPYSIFDRVLSTRWYDGTTTGLARCANCSSVFKYDLVDWDTDQERRIFVLSPTGPLEFDTVVEILRATEIPKWPFWNPAWKIEPPELKESTVAEVDGHLSRAADPEYVIASDRLLTKVVAVRELSESLLRKLPPVFEGLPVTNDFISWMEYLNSVQ